MNASIFSRLSVMMFLQFFMWSAWYVTAYLYLGTIGFGGTEIGWTYSVGPIAGMISPLFVGMIADRFFPTQWVLAIMHLLGAAAMFAAITVMQGATPSPTVINWLFFAYMLCYFPTLSLTNTLAMHNMTNSETQFPLIRVFGTIGWIAAGVLVSLMKWDASINIFYITMISSIVMGLFCFTLPHTPPPAAGEKTSIRKVLGLDALVLLAKPAYATFLFCSVLICVPLAFYYQMTSKFLGQAGISSVALVMSFGQMSEIFFMLIMPLCFARLGVKWMLLVGMFAWVLRYALFAFGAPDGVMWMLLLGVVLHGICYDFFFVTGQIYTDKTAPANIRGQAQGLLVLFTLGLGMLVGAKTAGFTEEYFTAPEAKSLKVQAEQLTPEITALETKVVSATEAEKPAIQSEIKTLADERTSLFAKASEIPPQWNWIWGLPAAGAAAIMLLFALTFRDTSSATNVDEAHVADAASREDLK